jgi:antitoxin (DNA-binding transcriptional repressor) of toxin-antitoxin stability system
MCHDVHMKTISVRELHIHTGLYVRQAAEEDLVITDRGRPVALVKRLSDELTHRPFPDRELRILELPRMKTDSTRLVAEDRGIR